MHKLPVGDNCNAVGGCSEPPFKGTLGGSIVHGVLDNWANSLPTDDPINMFFSTQTQHNKL